MNKNNIIKLACKKFNLTQKELAKELNIPIPTIARWARGDIPAQSKKLIELYIENRELKEKLSKISKALKIIKEFQEDL
jgi:transcriptional regulator with XRE-family HTH domain